MKIAVADACIFIDLYELKLTAPFFSLDIEVYTSVDVFNELYTEQKEVLKAFEAVGKLKVHNILSEERIEIGNMHYPKSLSTSDRTVLYLAHKLNAIVISSDKQVRKNAKLRVIEYHGMLWIFDMLLKSELIEKTEAIKRLQALVLQNIIYQNSQELIDEMNKRIKAWSA